jgi:deoxyuridine 5'-triphosphate nucleotidohydrolase
LAQFHFTVYYRPGSQAGKPDALSRRTEYADGEGEVHLTKILNQDTLDPIAAIAVQECSWIKFKKLNPEATIPSRGTPSSAGLDLSSIEDVVIPIKERRLVGTGLATALPEGIYGRIAPRSGLAAKFGITIDAGVVDADYRGELKVLMVNNGKESFIVKKKDRIGQLILERCAYMDPMEVDSLDETARGEGGFGSTGVSPIINSIQIGQLQVQNFHQDFKERVKAIGKKDIDYTRWLTTTSQDHDREVRDGLVFYKGRLQIPEDNAIRLEIATSEHDNKTAGHFGQKKTLELITRNFYWPKMDEWIKSYVSTCDTCQRNKSPRHARYGLLQPLELPYSPWISVSVDFIVALPLSEDYTQIMVVVDRFTKMAHFIALREDATTKDCAQAFLKEVWKLHGIPDEIISDRDSKWTSEFWKGLCLSLDIKRKMSTAFHPQTDGQSERVNQTLETYLRTYINYDQDNWYSLLPLAEFAYNNSTTSATKVSPFYANYGYHPKSNWPSTSEGKNPSSELYSHWMKAVHDKARTTLEETRNSMSKYYDQNKLPTPNYKEGELVMLNAKNIRTKRPSKKLAPKLYGPFKILKRIGSHAYQLQLQQRWRIHDVFHVSLLEPYRANSLAGRPQERPEPEEIEGQSEWEVETILQSEIRKTSRKVKGRNKTFRSLFYLVKWKGYPNDECTWEPGAHLEDALEEVDKFHQDNPTQPKL